MLKESKKTLDFVAFFVQVFIVRALNFAVLFWRDNAQSATFRDMRDNFICIVALVSQKRFINLVFNQGYCLLAIGGLARGQDEIQRIAERIAQPVNFGAEATTRSA